MSVALYEFCGEPSVRVYGAHYMCDDCADDFLVTVNDFLVATNDFLVVMDELFNSEEEENDDEYDD